MKLLAEGICQAAKKADAFTEISNILCLGVESVILLVQMYFQVRPISLQIPLYNPNRYLKFAV